MSNNYVIVGILGILGLATTWGVHTKNHHHRRISRPSSSLKISTAIYTIQ